MIAGILLGLLISGLIGSFAALETNHPIRTFIISILIGSVVCGTLGLLSYLSDMDTDGILEKYDEMTYLVSTIPEDATFNEQKIIFDLIEKEYNSDVRKFKRLVTKPSSIFLSYEKKQFIRNLEFIEIGD